jgi:hypothetical protein
MYLLNQTLFLKKSNLFFVITLLLFLPCTIDAQGIESRFAIETTYDGKTPVVFEENYGSLKLNSNTGDLVFTTNLKKFKTDVKSVDSLLSLQNPDMLLFKFSANLGQSIFGLINEENDNTNHKIIGTILVNNKSYPTEAYVNFKNLTEKSNLTKALIDLNFVVDPKIVIIPCLSDYFKNTLLFEMEDGYINQNM